MPKPAEVTLPSDREVRVTRTFNAPRQLVWDAHTKSELVPEWQGIEPAPDRHAVALRFRLPTPRPGALAIRTQLFPYDPVHQTFVNVYEDDALRQQMIFAAGAGERLFYSGTTQGAILHCLHHPLRLLACSTGEIHLCGDAPTPIRTFASGHRDLRLLRAAPAYIAALSGDRTRVVIWPIRSTQHLADLHLAAIAQNRIADFAWT